jgi:hypothetical protein
MPHIFLSRRFFLRGVALLFLLALSSGSCKSPVDPETLKKASIDITVDSIPVLVYWDYWVKLWYLRPTVTARETNGVGVNVTEGKMEFVYKNVGGYEPQTMSIGRIRAYGSVSINIEFGTAYGYDAVRFSGRGVDDNKNNVSTTKDFALKYVGLASFPLKRPY